MVQRTWILNPVSRAGDQSSGGQEVVLHPAGERTRRAHEGSARRRSARRTEPRKPLVEARGRLFACEGHGLDPRSLRLARRDRFLRDRRHPRDTVLMAMHRRLHHFPRRHRDVELTRLTTRQRQRSPAKKTTRALGPADQGRVPPWKLENPAGAPGQRRRNLLALLMCGVLVCVTNTTSYPQPVEKRSRGVFSRPVGTRRGSHSRSGIPGSLCHGIRRCDEQADTIANSVKGIPASGDGGGFEPTGLCPDTHIGTWGSRERREAVRRERGWSYHPLLPDVHALRFDLTVTRRNGFFFFL